MQPSTCYDRRPLDEEPFKSKFVALSLTLSRRSESIIAQGLRSLVLELEDDKANSWAQLAFTSPTRENSGTRHPVPIGKEARELYVTFYWKLSQNEHEATTFLREECSKRNISTYATPDTSKAAVSNRRRNVINEDIQNGVRNTSNRFHEINYRPKSVSPLAVRQSPVPPASTRVQYLDSGEALGSPIQPCQVVESFVTTLNDTIVSSEDGIYEQESRLDGDVQSTGLCFIPSSSSSSTSTTPSIPSQITAHNSSRDESSYTTLSKPILVPATFFPVNDNNPPSILDSCRDCEELNGEDSLTCMSPLEKNNPPGLDVLKPPLPLYPPIWAQSRQEVCESFDWFRSYQGGVYYTNDHVRGYLLSAFSSKRDIFEQSGRLIVSHGGGRAESSHSYRGTTVIQPADDQHAQDKSVRALLTNYRDCRPLVLLFDDKYALFPYDLRPKGISYAVLGFYTISHAWAEYQPAENSQGRVVRYKFLFQWCEGQGDPWWINLKGKEDECQPVHADSGSGNILNMMQNQESSYTLDVSMQSSGSIPKRTKLNANWPNTASTIYQTCSHCNECSPKVYSLEYLPYENLNYDLRFLQSSEAYSLPVNLRNILPNSPEIFGTGGDITTTYAFTRGLHCRACGRLSCRVKWEHWECMHCQKRVALHGRLRSPEEFWNEKLPAAFHDHLIQPFRGISEEPPRFFVHEYSMARVRTFVLPKEMGHIHHIQAMTPEGNKSADEIFKEYQEHASAGTLKFRRWPMRAHKCRGPLLTNYFSQNSGEPYQYVGGTANTVSFEETSSAVTKARDLIQSRILHALGKRCYFNEVLSAAYMESQKMAVREVTVLQVSDDCSYLLFKFHSDSERGLGPVVAGLSLGSPALMHFRQHQKNIPKREDESNPIVLTVVLRHGDVLVMDGASIQDRYEHTVVPTNFRIAATARQIGPLLTKSSNMSLLQS